MTDIRPTVLFFIFTLLALLLEEFACELLAPYLPSEHARKVRAPHLALSEERFLNPAVSSLENINKASLGEYSPCASSSSFQSGCTHENSEKSHLEQKTVATDKLASVATERVNTTPLTTPVSNRNQDCPIEEFAQLSDRKTADVPPADTTERFTAPTSMQLTPPPTRRLKRRHITPTKTSSRKRRRRVRRSKASDSEYSSEGK